MSRNEPYIFRTPRRLNQARADLYDWLIRNGLPASGAGPRPEDFDTESPIQAALNALSPQDGHKGQWEGSFDYLRFSIYSSELEHGVADHFDDRLSIFGNRVPNQRDATNSVTGYNSSRSPGSPKGRSIFVRAIRLALAASLILVAFWAFAFWREARVAEARIADAVQAHREAVAALSVSLPTHYATCYSAPQTIGCAAGAPVSRIARSDLEHAIATITRLIGAFADSPFVALHAAPLLTANSLFQCGIAAKNAARAEQVLHALCLGRVRLIEHLICANGGEPGAGLECHDMARLGIAGTRFESDAVRDLPLPVNVFSMPLVLSEELARLAALADAVAESERPGFAEMADAFLERHLSFGPNSAAREWISAMWGRVANL